MKKGAVVVVMVAIIALAGVLIYALTSGILEEPAFGDAMEVNASSQAASSTEASLVDLNAIKAPETTADILDAIDSAFSRNQDTVGWLTVPNTDISNSVLQSFDNNYYLRRNEQKQDEIYGCYFADYMCNFGSREALSANTIIYGHSDLTDNPEGPKFSQLFRFTDLDFAKKNQIINFSTLEESMNWQIFAVFYTDLNLKFVYPDLESAEFLELVEAAKERSLYQYNVDVTQDDKILTLVTCTVKYDVPSTEQRFIVMAKLLPEGEETSQLSEVAVNPNPVQPNFNREGA